jgi:hypothetical protein
MKFSDAIEAGWKDHEQIRGPFHNLKGSQEDPAVSVADVTGVCALGAASIAVAPEEWPDFAVVFKHWPELHHPVEPGSQAHELVRTASSYSRAWKLIDCVIYINDWLEYSKEEVIETVRSWGF